MSLVYLNEKSPSYKVWGTVNLSTNADGATGADVIDLGGLTLSAIHLSSACGSSCSYTFSGCADYPSTAVGSSFTTAGLAQIETSSGALLTYGSTATANVAGGTLLQMDPAFWSGVRYLMLNSNTTSARNSNSPGATAKIIASAFGMVK